MGSTVSVLRASSSCTSALSKNHSGYPQSLYCDIHILSLLVHLNYLHQSIFPFSFLSYTLLQGRDKKGLHHFSCWPCFKPSPLCQTLPSSLPLLLASFRVLILHTPGMVNTPELFTCSVAITARLFMICLHSLFLISVLEGREVN